MSAGAFFNVLRFARFIPYEVVAYDKFRSVAFRSVMVFVALGVSLDVIRSRGEFRLGGQICIFAVRRRRVFIGNRSRSRRGGKFGGFVAFDCRNRKVRDSVVRFAHSERNNFGRAEINLACLDCRLYEIFARSFRNVFPRNVFAVLGERIGENDGSAFSRSRRRGSFAVFNVCNGEI